MHHLTSVEAYWRDIGSDLTDEYCPDLTPGGETSTAYSYDDEVATLKQAFEFASCEECGDDLDAHTFIPDPLGHAQMLCHSEQNANDELSSDAARCPQLLIARARQVTGVGDA